MEFKYRYKEFDTKNFLNDYHWLLENPNTTINDTCDVVEKYGLDGSVYEYIDYTIRDVNPDYEGYREKLINSLLVEEYINYRYFIFIYDCYLHLYRFAPHLRPNVVCYDPVFEGVKDFAIKILSGYDNQKRLQILKDVYGFEADNYTVEQIIERHNITKQDIIYTLDQIYSYVAEKLKHLFHYSRALYVKYFFQDAAKEYSMFQLRFIEGAIKEGLLDEAMEYIDHYQGIRKDEELLEYRAYVYYLMNNYNSAIEVIDKYIKIFGSNEFLLELKQEIQIKLGYDISTEDNNPILKASKISLEALEETCLKYVNSADYGDEAFYNIKMLADEHDFERSLLYMYSRYKNEYYAKKLAKIGIKKFAYLYPLELSGKGAIRFFNENKDEINTEEYQKALFKYTRKNLHLCKDEDICRDLLYSLALIGNKDAEIDLIMDSNKYYADHFSIEQLDEFVTYARKKNPYSCEKELYCAMRTLEIMEEKDNKKYPNTREKIIKYYNFSKQNYKNVGTDKIYGINCEQDIEKGYYLSKKKTGDNISLWHLICWTCEIKDFKNLLFDKYMHLVNDLINYVSKYARYYNKFGNDYNKYVNYIRNGGHDE